MQRTSMQNGLKLLKVNFQLCTRLNLILSAGYLVLVPIIRGISNLDAIHSAECLEQAVSFIGVFLFIPITQPEHSSEIQEIIFSKRLPYTKIILLRLLIVIVALVLLIIGFSAIMNILNCDFPFCAYVAGTVISAMALGSCGFLATILSKSVIAGYSVAAGYFLLNLLGVISSQSKLSLFSMSDGIFITKYCLLAISLFFTVCAFLYMSMRKATSGFA